MDLIQYFLSKLLWLMIILGVGLILFIGVKKFAPNFLSSLSLTGNGSFFTDNWLPDPVNLQEATKPITADLSGNVYEGRMTPGTSYVIYTEKGMQIVNVPPKQQVFNAQTAGFSDNSIYVRNISVYSGKSIGTYETFTGEARSTFFTNGTFPVYVIDTQGRIFAKETAVATGQWSVPGWTRFSVQIRSLLPSHQPCQLLFVPDSSAPDANTNGRATIQVICN